MSDEFRQKLVQLAIGGYPKFRASDFEFIAAIKKADAVGQSL